MFQTKDFHCECPVLQNHHCPNLLCGSTVHIKHHQTSSHPHAGQWTVWKTPTAFEGSAPCQSHETGPRSPSTSFLKTFYSELLEQKPAKIKTVVPLNKISFSCCKTPLCTDPYTFHVITSRRSLTAGLSHISSIGGPTAGLRTGSVQTTRYSDQRSDKNTLVQIEKEISVTTRLINFVKFKSTNTQNFSYSSAEPSKVSCPQRVFIQNRHTLLCNSAKITVVTKPQTLLW